MIFVLLGLIGIFAVMGWLGWHGRWLFGVLLSIPFLAWLGWIEANTTGPPIWQDPYGPAVLVITLGPIGIGWIAFFLLRVTRHFSASSISGIEGHQ